MELFSFILEEDFYKNEDIYYLRLPDSWLDHLESKRIKGNKYKMKLQPSNLGKKLQVIFPSIFTVNWRRGNYWLISDEKVDCDLLRVICLNWFHKEERHDLSKEMTEVNLYWSKSKLGRLLTNQEFENFRFNFLAAFFARKFASEERMIEVDRSSANHSPLRMKLSFMHINYNGYHECMSELIYNKQKDFVYAYVIRFKYETRGFLPEKGILNVKIGTRRFLEKGIDLKKDLKWGKNGTILIGLKNPFYQNFELQSMAPFSFEFTWGKLSWKEGIDELFADILFEESSLDPKAILENPLKYKERSKVLALPVFSDLVYRFYHTTRAGIGLPEKSKLYDTIVEALPELIPLPRLKEVKGWTFSHKRFPLLHAFEKEKKFILEIWGKESLEKHLIENLLAENVLIRVSDQLFQLNASPGVYIEIVRRNPDCVIHALDTERHEKNAEIWYRKKLRNHLLKIDGRNKKDLILSLIEIHKHEKYGDNDPKEAIRQAFIKENRITQFIHPEDPTNKRDQYKHRLINSFYDLLTDIGFFPNHYKKLEFNGIILSLGFISGSRNFDYPILSKLDNTSLKIKMFGDDQWYSYPEALIKASQLTKGQFLNRYYKDGVGNYTDKIKAEKFFTRNLLDIVESTKDEIVVLVDHRIKYFISSFSNKEISLEKIFQSMKASKFKDRVHFIRVNSSDEIPQYRINVKGKKGVNRSAGVYKGSENIFYTVSVRPDTMQETRNKDLKYDFPKKHFMQQRITEFIPLSFSAEKLNELAILAFKMRRLSIPYEFHLRTPYLLHLNHKLKKYVSFIPDSTYSNEFNEEVEVNEQMEFDFSNI